MSGKAKPQKHTAKEIAQKHHEAKMRAGGRGGGEEGKEKRKAPKEGKKNIFIAYCKINRLAVPLALLADTHISNSPDPTPFTKEVTPSSYTSCQ